MSVAGYVALVKKIVNISDVYDEAELKSHSPEMHFLREVDRRTGYRTKQMLVAPLIDARTGDLQGVIQLINNKAGVPFNCRKAARPYIGRRRAGFIRARPFVGIQAQVQCPKSSSQGPRAVLKAASAPAPGRARRSR